MRPDNRRTQSVIPRPILHEPSNTPGPGPRAYPIQLDSTATAMAALVLLIAPFFLCFFSACARRLFSLVHRRDAHLYTPSILPHPRRCMPYPPPYGLDPATLQSLPIAMGRKEFGCCVVCLSDFEEKDHVKIIPRCGHRFHPACIDVWLLMQGTCPVCRCTDMVSAANRCYPGLDSVPVNDTTSIDNSGCTSGINLEQVIEVMEEHRRDGKELLVRLERWNSWGHELGTARNAHDSSIRRTVSF